MIPYLDCNATTPLDPAVRDIVMHFLTEEYGNSGSRTHDYGSRAKQAVYKARNQIAKIVNAQPEEAIFTSGATESNNLAILGLAEHGLKTGNKHIISTQIEHKAILEPLQAMEKQGFEVTWLAPNSQGRIELESIHAALREDTLLVSVMQVNNETGVSQPIPQIAELLANHSAYFHTDAAQGFGKEIAPLQHPRLDLISISGHKLYAPKGIGALIARRRNLQRPPLQPLMYGGGQERGLRPGTLPVALVAGLGLAAELAMKNQEKWADICKRFKVKLLAALAPLNPIINGDPDSTLPHVVNLSIPGLDSEAMIVATKDLIAISNGSACTSKNYEPSHVLTAMQLPEDVIDSALRLSWCHLTSEPDWDEVIATIQRML